MILSALRLSAVTIAVTVAAGCQHVRHPVILVVDQDAGGAGHPGAIFALDLEDESVPAHKKVRLFATSPLMRQPQDILQRPDGSFLVLDYFDEGGVGKIFRLSRDGKECAEVPIPPGLVDPYQFETAPDGSIWIVDKNADPRGIGKAAGTKTGTLWRLSADLTSLQILATGPPLAAPSGLLFAANGEAYLMDADSFRGEKFDLSKGEGGIFKVRQHPTPLETVVRFQTLVSPLGFCREPSGDFLVVDVNADPVERARIHGAVYRIDAKTGAATLFANHADFRDPVNCLAWAGGLLVVDANADPLGLGDDGALYHYGGSGRGGIYRVDLATGAVTLFAASPEFVNPIRLRAASL